MKDGGSARALGLAYLSVNQPPGSRAAHSTHLPSQQRQRQQVCQPSVKFNFADDSTVMLLCRYALLGPLTTTSWDVPADLAGGAPATDTLSASSDDPATDGYFVITPVFKATDESVDALRHARH
jgi:hypothetical protein